MVRWLQRLAVPGLLLGTAAFAEAAYEAEMAAFAAQDAAKPPPDNVIVFTGSSSITGWSGLAAAFPGQPVLNRGFGGSQMNDVLEHYESLVPPYAPPLVVLYEGDNDIQAGESPAAVFAEYVTFTDRLAADFPDTCLIIIAVKPSPSRVSKMAAMAQLNGLLQNLCEARPNLRFADVFTPMLNAAGQPRPELFGSDMLHMNAAGYAIWTEVLTPLLAASPFPEEHNLYLDFGNPADPPLPHWNTVTPTVGSTAGGQLNALINGKGIATAASLVITQHFDALNDAGTTTSGLFPPAVTRDSLFGHTATFNGQPPAEPAFRLTGLDPALQYRLSFYASRTGITGNRDTLYTVTGSRTATTLLDVANNVHGLASVADMAPDAAGEIRIGSAPGPANASPEGFSYLGALKIAGAAPAPADLTPPLLLSGSARSGTLLELTFNEPLDPASAVDVSHYTLPAGSPPISTATLQTGGKTVALLIASALTGQVTVTVTGVLDAAGNPVAAGSSVNFAVPAFSSAAMLFDFGGSAITAPADDPARTWNNVTGAIGNSDTATLNNLVTTANLPTTASLQMIRRFNGVNTNGTTASTRFPRQATEDTLFGNTATFGGLTNIFPSFRLTGLDPSQTYDFLFYASRMAVSDNRETRYTLEGASTAITHLQAAGNIDASTSVQGLRPTAEGNITISLTPGPANNNTNRFTYLGLMQVTPAPPLEMLPPILTGTHIQLFWTGFGQLEHAASPMGPWSAIQPAPSPPYSDALLPTGRRFYRLRSPAE